MKNGINEHPHLFELGECYNELYHKMPKDLEHNYTELIFTNQTSELDTQTRPKGIGILTWILH